jgi:hypothetical protein
MCGRARSAAAAATSALLLSAQQGLDYVSAGGHRTAEPAGAAGRRRLAEANIRAQQALLEILLQQKAYQRVVAPLDALSTLETLPATALAQRKRDSVGVMMAGGR